MPSSAKLASDRTMHISRTTTNIEADAERVLRSLPMWFGQEESTLEYIRETSANPTFVAVEGDTICGFITLKQHAPESVEITCVATQADKRNAGIGRALVEHAQSWASAQGVRFMQVKTLADTHPSIEYAQTRSFYARMGFVPLEVFPGLWDARTPCLQLIKYLP